MTTESNDMSVEWDDATWAMLDQALTNLEQCWRKASIPSISQLLPVDRKDPRFEEFLFRLVAVDQQCRSRIGLDTAWEDYFADWPELRGSTQRLAELAESEASNSAESIVAGNHNQRALKSSACASKIVCPHCAHIVTVLEDNLLEAVTCPKCQESFEGVDGISDSDSSQPHVRKTIAHFELFEQLGSGTFGAVWRANDTKLDKIVAIKMPHLTGAEEHIERFIREARAAAQLRHPNIVGVQAVGREHDQLYIVSDFVDGVPLDEASKSHKFSYQETAVLGEKIAKAIHYAHERQVIHRDLKPQNILIDDAGEPQIADFGLARRESGETTMTVDGQVIGTAAYLSPEQAKGESHVADRRSDIYCLGVVLFELLTGERPFRGSVPALLKQHAEDSAPSLRSLDTKVPRDLETICLKCLEKDPKKRFSTAAELAGELRRHLHGDPIRARRISRQERLWRWCRRNPVPASLSLSIVALVVVSIVFITWQWRKAVAATENARAATKNEALATRGERESRKFAEATAYFTRIALIEQAWRTGDVPRAKRLLHAIEQSDRNKIFRGWEFRYLQRLCNSELFILKGHSPSSNKPHADVPVLDVAYSSDGRLLATAGGGNLLYLEAREKVEPGEIIIRDVHNQYSRLHTLTGHKHLVTAVAFSPDSKHIASASLDGTVRMWDIETGQQVWTSGEIVNHITKDNFKFQCIAFASDSVTLAAAGDSSELFVWDTKSGKRLTEEIHVPTVQAIAFRPGPGSILVLCSSRAADSLVIVDLDDQTDGPSLLEAHSDRVLDVTFSSDGRLLATVGQDKMLMIRDAATFDVKKVITHDAALKSVAFSPDGKLVGATGADGSVHIWKVDTENPYRTIRGHLREARSLAFSPDGTALASASTDGTTRIWSLASDPRGTLIKQESNGMPVDLVFRSDNRTLVTATSGSVEGEVKTHVPGGQPSQNLTIYLNTADWDEHPRSDYAFSPNGQYLAAPLKSDPSMLGLWDSVTGKLILRLPGHTDRITASEFSPDGRNLLTAQSSNGRQATGQITIWSLETSSSKDLELSASLSIDVDTPSGECELRCLAMSHDGELIACGDIVNECIHIFDKQGNRKNRIDGEACKDVTFSRDGTWIAAANKRKSQVHRISVASGKSRILDAPQDVNSVCFSPDGKRLVASGYNGDVMMWDTETAMEVFLLRGFGPPPGELGGTSKVVFSSDGNRLASLNIDKSINVWDTEQLHR